MQPETRMPSGVGKPESNSDPMRRTRKAFEQMGKMKAPARPLFERFFDRLLPSLPDSQQLDWGDEADWARLQREPVRARWLLWTVVIVVILLLTWAAFAEIDEVTRGDGKVIPLSKMQVIQAFDPGRVDEILVHEGQVVDPQQLLLRVDPSRFVAEFGAADAKRLGLVARVARFKALSEGSEFVMPDEVIRHDPSIAAQELKLYQDSRTEAETHFSIVRQQLTQREQELRETEALHMQAFNSLKLAREELRKNEPLLASGAVSEVEIIRLQQNIEKFDGDRRQAAERIGRARAAINEAQNKVQEAELNKRNEWREEYSRASSELATVAAGTGLSQDKVKQAEVRSPVRGKVNRLLVTTVGGIVSQGQELVEIVPLDDKLLIEAKVKPKDIAFLREGLPVLVKITAYDFAIYGGLDGTLTQVSADTVTDDKGNAFYLIKVQTDTAMLGEGKNSASSNGKKRIVITPGMVAEVNVLTGKKTVLSYLLKPVLRAKANAMTER
jgi:adhesin transport system membrane fusion protein